MTTHNEGPALLDVKAVAALFQASPSTIWRRVNARHSLPLAAEAETGCMVALAGRAARRALR